MFRSSLFLLKLGLIVAIAVLVAYQPGEVSLQWLGYRVDAHVGYLLAAVLVLVVVSSIAYRYWRLLVESPRKLGQRFGEGRKRRGYRALTQGMVAVAAGDPEEAARWARKAEVLMEEPPLTLLLLAQAAQMNGNEQAAKRYFETMLDKEETRFMGLRGLLMQALREGDRQAALGYVRQAQAIRPKADWVVSAMIELSEATGDYTGAEQAIKQAERLKVLPRPEATRKRAVVLVEQAMDARAEGRAAEAVKLARAAHKLVPELVPATALLAELLVAEGRSREAAKVVERAWPSLPHPDLVRAYRTARPADDALDQLAGIKRLTMTKPEDRESLIALGEAALEAQLWGEARRYLGQAMGDAPSERLCRLMARLEEQEHGDAERARAWLLRAGTARRDPAWTCESCGAIAAQWQAHCGACDAFDSLAWRRPRQVDGEPAGTDAGPPLVPVRQDDAAPARPAIEVEGPPAPGSRPGPLIGPS